MPRLIIAACLAALLGLALTSGGAAQETKQLRWDRYDVTIDLRSDGTFRVCELYDIQFVRGSFSTGFAVIPLDRVVSIQEVQVSEGNQPYRPGDGRQPNTFSSRRENGTLRIDYAFPATSGRSRSFTVCYTVIGGLRVYDFGIQLWWKAVPGKELGFAIGSSTTTVRLPVSVPHDKLVTRTFDPRTKVTIVDDRTVRFESGSVPAGQEIEIGVQLPPGTVAATKPPWQEHEDAAAAREAALKPYRDLANLALGGLALLILVGGGIGAYALWYHHGRDLPVGKVAEYLREPPDDSPPAVVGTLLDEQADVKDVLATIPWLGSRGVLQMTEISSGGIFGLGAQRDFLFQRLPSDAPLADYEATILRAIFGSADEARLSELKGHLMAQLPAIQQQLYSEVVRRGYFAANPAGQRLKYRLFGFGVAGLAVVLGVTVAPAIADFASWVFLPVVALGAVGIVLIGLAQVMARKTRAGALAAAKWQAFRRYLEHIERYEHLDQARDIFERYLPYATVFGLERAWVRKFAEVNAPAPVWYGTEPLIYEPGYGYRRRSYGTPGHYGGAAPGEVRVEDATAPAGGLPDLQGASDRMMAGLQGMSDGLLDMFESAGKVFSSRPPSSGGGGWSGGGFSGGGGGGGGGGGSRGFG